MVSKQLYSLSIVVLLGTVASMLLFLRTLQLKSRKMTIEQAQLPREAMVNSSIIIMKKHSNCCDDKDTSSSDGTNSVNKTTNATHNHNISTSTNNKNPKGILASALTLYASPIPIPNCHISNMKATAAASKQNNLPPRKIFVDFGANDGKSVELFLVGDISDQRNQALASFHKNNYSLRAHAMNDTGTPFNSHEWELHVFEANPWYTTMLSEQQAMLTTIRHTGPSYNNHNHVWTNQDMLVKLNVSSNMTAVKSYHLYGSTAIVDYPSKNATVEFILDNNKTGAEGSTTMRESKSAVGKRITINATDIVTFFRTTLQARIEDYIVVKLDIEGAEYGLLRRMIDQCLFPYIDRIGVEWHHKNIWVFADKADIRMKYTQQHARIIEALNSTATYDPKTGKNWLDKVTLWG